MSFNLIGTAFEQNYYDTSDPTLSDQVNNTLLGVKIAARTRLPASYFVTVAYLCWACRRRGLRVPADGPLQWLN